VPCDFVVENPAVGVPTDIRIPISRVKSIYQSGSPAAVPGDQTRMICIFGEAIDCGLRLDTLSLVELRSPGK
jgi:hypothetical protein